MKRPVMYIAAICSVLLQLVGPRQIKLLTRPLGSNKHLLKMPIMYLVELSVKGIDLNQLQGLWPISLGCANVLFAFKNKHQVLARSFVCQKLHIFRRNQRTKKMQCHTVSNLVKSSRRILQSQYLYILAATGCSIYLLHFILTCLYNPVILISIQFCKQLKRGLEKCIPRKQQRGKRIKFMHRNFKSSIIP